MLAIYEKSSSPLEIYFKKNSHVSPHLHKALECVYLAEGTLEIGVGEELFHMEKGDFAVIFPELIHHFQVFCTGISRAYYLLASPSLAGPCLDVLQQSCPKCPVIPQKRLHPDVAYALRRLRTDCGGEQKPLLRQAYLQIILARCLPCFELEEKSAAGSGDIIYQTVSYVAAHFREEISLTGMSHDLGVSPYVLSRLFSSTFHRNFNQYVNDMRLDAVCSQLEYTDCTITEAYEDAGFNSQRTFNRVFMNRYHMTPRQYRAALRKERLDADGVEPTF